MKNRRKKIIGGIAVAAILVVGGGYAWAATSDQQELDNSNPEEIEVTEEQALTIFSDEYDQTVESLELETSRDGYMYDVESYDNQTEYNTTIDANSGDIIDTKSDNDDDEDEEEHRYELDQQEAISREEASEIAENEAGGGQAREWKLERVSDSTQIWEVNVLENGNETEVAIDAEDSEVLEVEQDDD